MCRTRNTIPAMIAINAMVLKRCLAKVRPLEESLATENVRFALLRIVSVRANTNKPRTIGIMSNAGRVQAEWWRSATEGTMLTGLGLSALWNSERKIVNRRKAPKQSSPIPGNRQFRQVISGSVFH